MSKIFFYTFVMMHSLVSASEQQPVTHYQILPDEIICLIGTSFSPAIKPHEANIFVKHMLFTCKATYTAVRPYINDVNYTRVLINKIGNNRHQDIVAKQLNLPGARLYLNKNNPLHARIVEFHEATIRRFFTEGADPNYFPLKKMPLIFVAVPDCTRVKILLEHGANPNATFNNETLLQYAIKIHHVPLVRLVLQHNPRDKCLRHAISAEQNDIFELIMKSAHLSLGEIYRTFPYALQYLNEKVIKALLNTGINPSPYLRQAILDLRRYYYKGNQPATKALLNIVDLMCQHGAWNKNAYSIARTSKYIPAQIIKFLENGRLKAIEKILKK